MTPAAHIAGVPIEETLLALGGPAAIYVALLGAVATIRRAGVRLRANARRRPGVEG
jgi:hypothetical protein